MSDVYTKLYLVRTNSYYSDSAVFKNDPTRKNLAFTKVKKVYAKYIKNLLQLAQQKSKKIVTKRYKTDYN